MLTYISDQNGIVKAWPIELQTRDRLAARCLQGICTYEAVSTIVLDVERGT